MTDYAELSPADRLHRAADQLSACKEFCMDDLIDSLRDCAAAYNHLKESQSKLQAELHVWESRAVRSGLCVKELMAENDALQTQIHALKQALFGTGTCREGQSDEDRVQLAKGILKQSPSQCLDAVRQEAVLTAVGSVRLKIEALDGSAVSADKVLDMVLNEVKFYPM